MNEQDKKTIKTSLIIFAIAFSIFMINRVVILINKPNEEEALNKLLNTVGARYYEDIYYKQNSKNKELLEDISKVGLTVDLKTALIDLDYYADRFRNKKTDELCDLSNSIITIYPKAPYGKTDYKIEGNLSCGFDGE